MLKDTTRQILGVARSNKVHTTKSYRKRVYLGLRYYRSVPVLIDVDLRGLYYVAKGASGDRKVGWG